jgi:hypothetical protein
LHSLHPQHFAFVPCIFGQLTLIFHLFLHFPLLFLICILLFFLIVNLRWFSGDLHWGVNVLLLYVLIVLEMSKLLPAGYYFACGQCLFSVGMAFRISLQGFLKSIVLTF